uniref:Uncharacterized protein n=1 Tax=Nelumbo nucifera TaxID=4432 RepID=A0A822Y0E9_NELNU|nr:TPA_asm: hypothetical protein HUJ06_026213 [Nelumbo nucifera]
MPGKGKFHVNCGQYCQSVFVVTLNFNILSWKEGCACWASLIIVQI